MSLSASHLVCWHVVESERLMSLVLHEFAAPKKWFRRVHGTLDAYMREHPRSWESRRLPYFVPKSSPKFIRIVQAFVPLSNLRRRGTVGSQNLSRSRAPWRCTSRSLMCLA